MFKWFKGVVQSGVKDAVRKELVNTLKSYVNNLSLIKDRNAYQMSMLDLFEGVLEKLNLLDKIKYSEQAVDDLYSTVYYCIYKYKLYVRLTNFLDRDDFKMDNIGDIFQLISLKDPTDCDISYYIKSSKCVESYDGESYDFVVSIFGKVNVSDEIYELPGSAFDGRYVIARFCTGSDLVPYMFFRVMLKHVKSINNW